MFLFNKYKNSQQNNPSGNKIYSIKWKTFLNTNPIFGAESTSVIDKEGNIYFGSHSGNFYSLNSSGKIRWTFTTKVKIYSSPLLIDNSVYFVGGDGYLYSLSLNGDLIWLYDLAEWSKSSKYHKLLSFLIHLPFTYSFGRKKNINYRSWCSPNTVNGKIFVTGFGKGLFCFNQDGTVEWNHDLGFPRYQLSGVTIDNNNNIYVSSRKGYAYCFSINGIFNWKRKIKLFWEPWGNPVYCTKTNQCYFFFSKNENKGLITALNSKGELKWYLKLGAIRGSCAISICGQYFYCCDLDGYLYKVKSEDGQILIKKKITSCIRGLWTTPTIDSQNNILLSAKDSNTSGRLLKLNEQLEIIWEFKTGKVLSIPLVLENGELLFGTWDGHYYNLKTIN
jgi:outer membrane protein assembly factor BamB